jgi:hypothetical protein
MCSASSRQELVQIAKIVMIASQNRSTGSNGQFQVADI